MSLGESIRVDARPFCFLHIGKTGGTTMLDAIDRSFPPADICPFRQMEELEAMTAEQMLLYKVFRGHFWMNASRLFPVSPLFGTMLRNPLERSRSTYQHIHRYPHGRHEIVSKMSFAEYISAPNEVSLEIDNWQTRVLTGCVDPALAPDLSLAKKNLNDQFVFVGLTERFEQSVKIFCKVLGIPEVSYDFLNVTSNPLVLNDLPCATRDALTKKNLLDLELYGYASLLFERKSKELSLSC